MALASDSPLEPFTIDHFIAYAERLVLDTGERWQVEDFQLDIVEPILNGVREVWALVPECNAKHLDVRTPLPTPEGWTTMLDIRVGDEVLGADGKPTQVVHTSEVFFGRDCYRITFSDGAQIVCSGEHHWPVQDAQDHYRDYVHSTRYLYNRSLSLTKNSQRWGQSNAARWRIKTGSRHVSPEVDLPIDPYVLGLWLGDGETNGARVTNMDSEIWNQLEADYDVAPRAPSNEGQVAATRYVRGLKTALRATGLLGNKHIPEQYLIADEDARWSLLQGLMDTDGTVSKAGQATYCSTRRRLATDVQRLAWSLGLPAYVNESRAVMDGVDYGPSFKVTIACDQRHPVVRLPRKVARLKAHGSTCDHRRIKSIERITSVPVKCIQVAAPDHLYLAGEAYMPTHNSTLMAGFALYHADYTPSPWVPIGASSRDQAEIMFMQAAEIVRSTPGMVRRFRVYEGYRRIVSLRNGGRGIRVYAADANTGDGVIPTLALLDEGHRHPDLSLYRLWKGKLNKRKGQIVMISTAGEPGSEFEETRDLIRAKAPHRRREAAHVISEGPNIVMHEWTVEREAWISDMEKVKEANPLSTITEDSLLLEWESPTTDLGDWKRLKPLAVDTPIPTPDGWTTMLELKVGDQVLNGDGMPTTITAATPVKLDQAYEVEFSDGAKIRATGDHLWEVEDARNHHRSVVRSTEELAELPYLKDGRGRPFARWRVPLAARRVGPEIDLPIDPYVLGVWLGDGSKDTGHIRNGDPEVWAEIEARGYDLGSLAPSLYGMPSKRMQTLLRLRPVLRGLGLLGDKHIPRMYLVAPEEARWELLQGLMDADGTVLEEGRAIFWNTNARLVGDVRRLVWSLGRPCIEREDRAVLEGVDHGPRWALEIPCDSRHPVVRLSRKAARLRDRGKTCDHRRIRSITPVGEELVRCIAVDAADSIFLAGEAMIRTHNCNIPSRTVYAAITEEEWYNARATEAEIPRGEHIDLGIDVAWKHDTFSIAPLWNGPEYRLLGAPIILTPPRDGSSMHPDVVKTAIEHFVDTYQVDAAVIDIERAEDIAAWLEDEHGVMIIDRPQGNAPAVEDYDAFMAGLRNGKLKHTGDKGLHNHVMNAIARNLPGDKKRFDRPSQSRAKKRQNVRVIDALTAAAMVNHYAGEFSGGGEPMVAWR